MLNVRIFYRHLKNLKALFNIRLEDNFKNDKIVIFHHIPKCAGTSINNTLEKWYFLKMDTYYRKGYYFREKINLNKLKNCHCITGHFEYENFYIKDRYPEIYNSERFRLITFIRDPLKTSISLYYYGKKLNVNHIPLTEFLFKEKNYIANRFPCNEDNYKEILDKYFFIGITERLDLSIKILSKIFNKPYIKTKIFNKSEKDSQIQKISEEMKNNFIEYNSLDYKIYNYCLNKFSSYID